MVPCHMILMKNCWQILKLKRTVFVLQIILGLTSAMLGELSFEELIDFWSEEGLECVELACWPVMKTDRRYAGVTHVDVASLTKEKTDYINKYCLDRNVDISALAYYPNTLDENPEKRRFYISHLYKVIDAAKLLGVNLVNTFIGRMTAVNLTENMKEAAAEWPAILRYAEDREIKISIENCPMLFIEDEWSGGQNIMTSPANRRKIFGLLRSDSLSIYFDQSHLVWQQMDYIKPVYEFKDRIFHIHFNDIKLFKDRLDDVGIMETPLEYMSPQIPDLGDVDWAKFVSALTDIGYDGYACIEIEDKAFKI